MEPNKVQPSSNEAIKEEDPKSNVQESPSKSDAGNKHEKKSEIQQNTGPKPVAGNFRNSRNTFVPTKASSPTQATEKSTKSPSNPSVSGNVAGIFDCHFTENDKKYLHDKLEEQRSEGVIDLKNADVYVNPNTGKTFRQVFGDMDVDITGVTDNLPQSLKDILKSKNEPQHTCADDCSFIQEADELDGAGNFDNYLNDFYIPPTGLDSSERKPEYSSTVIDGRLIVTSGTPNESFSSPQNKQCRTFEYQGSVFETMDSQAANNPPATKAVKKKLKFVFESIPEEAPPSNKDDSNKNPNTVSLMKELPTTPSTNLQQVAAKPSLTSTPNIDVNVPPKSVPLSYQPTEPSGPILPPEKQNTKPSADITKSIHQPISVLTDALKSVDIKSTKQGDKKVPDQDKSDSPVTVHENGMLITEEPQSTNSNQKTSRSLPTDRNLDALVSRIDHLNISQAQKLGPIAIGKAKVPVVMDVNHVKAPQCQPNTKASSSSLNRPIMSFPEQPVLETAKIVDSFITPIKKQDAKNPDFINLYKKLSSDTIKWLRKLEDNEECFRTEFSRLQAYEAELEKIEKIVHNTKNSLSYAEITQKALEEQLTALETHQTIFTKMLDSLEKEQQNSKLNNANSPHDLIESEESQISSLQQRLTKYESEVDRILQDTNNLKNTTITSSDDLFELVNAYETALLYMETSVVSLESRLK